jgi:predicted nucleotidyltransferase
MQAFRFPRPFDLRKRMVTFFLKNVEMNYNVQILKDLKKKLNKQLGQGEVLEVILFGSRISNSPQIGSDYDILIITRRKGDWKFEDEILSICYNIDLKYGIILDPHILAEKELNTLRGKQPIFSNALKSGIYA